MQEKLKSKEELRALSDEARRNNQYYRVWDNVYLTDVYDRAPEGTIHEVMKLYDLDDDGIRISFAYHIGGGFRTEYLYNQEDMCDMAELLEYGKRIYEEVTSKRKFSPQPDWID